MHALSLRRLWNAINRLSPSSPPSPSQGGKDAGAATDADCNSNRSGASTAGGGGAGAAAVEVCRPPERNCFRLVILGSSKVGKTAIVARFLHNKFDENYTPTIEDFHRKLYRIRGEVYQLDILDTSGNHPFPAMRRLSFLTGDLFILVYSVDSRDSFEEVCRLREQIIETKCGASSAASGGGRPSKKPPRIPMVIVGNKCDKDADRTVTPEEVANYVANLPCCAFVETSAKRNVRVEDVFCELFVLGQLPLEMSPSLHKRVQPGFLGFCQSPTRRGLSLRRRLSDAYGTVAPNARRPSIRTDLLILQTKTSAYTGPPVGRRREIPCVLQ